jgi:speckle-type POZ protein
VFISGQETNRAIPVPPSDLSRHYGELFRSQAGADVTFSVAGESFAAHKSVLGPRGPPSSWRSSLVR